MDDWQVTQGLSTLKRAQKEIAEVESLLHGDRRRAEQRARSALATFASAMNLLEDSEYFDEAHDVLDAAGRYVRRTFGCSLQQEGLTYSQTCPVAIAHKRFGVSPEILIGVLECTICGKDAEECV